MCLTQSILHHAVICSSCGVTSDQVAGTPGTVVLIHTDTGLSLSLVTNMLTALVVSGLVATAAAQYAGCPEPYGLQVYPHEQYCDKFYKCANGKYNTLDY